MTVAENLLLAAGKIPALIDWKTQRAALENFLQTTPFQLDLDAALQQQQLSATPKSEQKDVYIKPLTKQVSHYRPVSTYDVHSHMGRRLLV